MADNSTSNALTRKGIKKIDNRARILSKIQRQSPGVAMNEQARANTALARQTNRQAVQQAARPAQQANNETQRRTTAVRDTSETRKKLAAAFKKAR